MIALLCFRGGEAVRPQCYETHFLGVYSWRKNP